ncbi:MAG: YjgP/YjgQ family permease [Cytophagales bacterium]|nr:YjgP/YjgQ family permease [Cytophagales bacterium]
MFRLIDRYILKKYLTTFFFMVFALVMIICVIDFTEKNEDFIQQNVGMDKVLLDYYFNFIPYLANFLSPITIFLSTILVTAQMASHTEIIAILSSGVSFRRILWSYAQGAILLGLLIFYLIGWVIPKANITRVDFEIQYTKKQYYYDEKNTHIRLDSNNYAYINRYNNVINVGYDFTLERFENKELVEKLRAQRVDWDSTRKSWVIKKYWVRKYKDGKEELSYKKASIDTVLNIAPGDFKSQFKKHEIMTLPELEQYIAEEKERGIVNLEAFIIDRYERYTYPFAIIILTMIGVIVSARKSREGIGMQILLGIILAFVYILFVLAGRAFTESNTIPPLLSAWLPNIVFTGIGLVLYRTIPR